VFIARSREHGCQRRRRSAGRGPSTLIPKANWTSRPSIGTRDPTSRPGRWRSGTDPHGREDTVRLHEPQLPQASRSLRSKGHAEESGFACPRSRRSARTRSWLQEVLLTHKLTGAGPARKVVNGTAPDPHNTLSRKHGWPCVRVQRLVRARNPRRVAELPLVSYGRSKRFASG
jgi:hypothetical protein